MPLTTAGFKELALVAVLSLAGCGNDDGLGGNGDPGLAGDADLCPRGEAVETDGVRRLALIVGVGQYRHDAIPDLVGPPNDARRIYRLLTGSDGYGFPRENVCLLLDRQATTAEFRRAFDEALVQRARPQDLAVVFYAGHGSQARDQNADEADGLDETLMLHDARSDGVRDLRDDDFHRMLTQLHARTRHITVILDSCNAGSATRGDAGTYAARFFEPDLSEVAATSSGQGGDGDAGWIPEAMPGLVTMTAATDGTSALETDGKGIFTDALIRVLGPASDQPLTYAQVARQVPPLVAASSYQVPYFHGDLNTPVFGSEGRTRPLGWDLVSAGVPLELAGPPLPGIGVGAELRLYDGAVRGEATRDPGKAKATVVIDRLSGLNAEAHVSAARPDAEPPAVGDLAVLVRPANAYLRIRVRLRPEPEPGGIAPARAGALREAIADDPEARTLVRLTEAAGDFELSVASDGKLVLRGPENRVRNVYDDDAAVADNLWQHARQRALLQLQGEGGAEFTDNRTLQVQLVPSSRQSGCEVQGSWQQAPANTEQRVPLCQAWHVKVSLEPAAPMPLLVGAVVLSSDGQSYGLPADGRLVTLHPGESVVFDSRLETFVGRPPLDVRDHLMVFGTQLTNPVPWHLLTDTAARRAAGPARTGLYGALDDYLQPGSRGAGPVEAEAVEDTTWTLSTLRFRVTDDDV